MTPAGLGLALSSDAVTFGGPATRKIASNVQGIVVLPIKWGPLPCAQRGILHSLITLINPPAGRIEPSARNGMRVQTKGPPPPTPPWLNKPPGARPREHQAWVVVRCSSLQPACRSIYGQQRDACQ